MLQRLERLYVLMQRAYMEEKRQWNLTVIFCAILLGWCIYIGINYTPENLIRKNLSARGIERETMVLAETREWFWITYTLENPPTDPATGIPLAEWKIISPPGIGVLTHAYCVNEEEILFGYR